MSDSDLISLARYFRVERHGKDYHIYCKTCGRGWSLAVDKVGVGALLKLLDHAHSHKENDE